MIRRLRVAFIAACGLTMSGVAPAFAQDDGEGGEAEPRVVFAFSHAGVKNWFVDEKDAELARAVELLGPRVMELKNTPSLREELDEVPDSFVRSIIDLAYAPMHFVVTTRGMNDETGAPNLGAVLSFRLEDEAAARRMHRTVREAFDMAGQPFETEASQRFAGMREFVTPVGAVSFGPREADDGLRYEVVLGAMEDLDGVRGYLPGAPVGGDRVASVVLDFEALTPFSNIGLALLGAAPQGEVFVEQIRRQGLVGEGAMRMEYTEWYSADAAHSQLAVRRAHDFRDALFLAEAPLTGRDLAVVPADATAAYISKHRVRDYLHSLKEQIASFDDDARREIEKGLERFEDETGVDLEEDIVNALGETVAMYFSDSTGGGSLLSGVMLVEAAKPDRLMGAIAKLTELAESQLNRELPAELDMVRLKLSARSVAGRDVMSIRLVGAPLPIGPSMTMQGPWLVMGFSPQAVVAAADVVSAGGRQGLLANPAFAAAYDPARANIQVAFVDSRRTMRDGVGLMNVLASALASFVGSPDDAERRVEMIVPTLPRLSANARPIVVQTFWRGDDLLQVTTADRSMLVNAAGLLGVGDATFLFPAIAALVPAAIENAGRADQMRWEEAPADEWDNDWDEDEEDWDGDARLDSDGAGAMAHPERSMTD
jgi:hypothetical protein